MRAQAAVAVARSAGGGPDRLAVLRSEPPLTLRPTPTGVYLVGTAAGPLAGDELGLDVAVGDGAELTVRSAAATLVQPGASAGARPSVLRIDARIGSGGHLSWAPEPTVAVRGCDHEVHVRVRLDPGATLLWREELVLGRHGEAPGSVLARLAVDRAGGALVRNDLAIGPRWPGSLGPAGVGVGTRAVGTAVVVGPPAHAMTPGPVTVPGGGRAAVLALADEAALVMVLAPSTAAVRATLDVLIAATDISP